MAELGYQRSAKKCKEKFENVYKYHKRTKEGRSSKSDGKTYRFFDQLEALDQLQPFQIPPPPSLAPKAQPQPFHPPGPPPGALQTPTTISFAQQPCNTTNININPNPIITPTNPSTTKFMSAANFMVSTSSSTSSDDFQAQRRGGKKRKWKDFFEKLMRDVVEKQEELQTKFLRSIEMRERERSMREESWRMQEIARLNREHEILVQERSASAAKDAAVIAFLQKISGQQPQTPQNQPPPLPQPQPKQANVIALDRNGAGGHNKMMMVSRENNTSTPPSSSRWPKAEVEALIKLRTSFETKYQENGPKGPFWEEISAGMRSLGYTRSSKRCKEKWENINKYFKKVKESNKQRPEDSKTCPYYHLLDAIYKEKKGGSNGGEYNNNHLQFPSANSLMEPLMVQPEQQWPLAPPQTLAAHQNLNEEEEEQDDMLDEDELDQDMEDEEEDEDEEAENNNNNGGTFEVFNNNNNPQHGSASSAPTGSIGTTAVA